MNASHGIHGFGTRSRDAGDFAVWALLLIWCLLTLVIGVETLRQDAVTTLLFVLGLASPLPISVAVIRLLHAE